MYVEPNHFNIQGDKALNYNEIDGYYLDNNKEIAPDLSDFCISVDLEVEVHDKISNITSNQGSKVFIMKFYSGNDKDNYSVSFLSGTKQSYGNKDVNSLSTSPYDCSTIVDIINSGSTSEMFGINSIDIEYNNYMVPVVTINFTDIRGVSLFSPEELRHDKEYNGIQGYSNSDIAGSFFKCFFTFPYPKFSLMVKGFYGHPVTYELTCSDFKASFNSSTGNFNATAQFIGYSFALINDVTMNALVAAPLSKYGGSDYWENSKFMFDDNVTLIPTLNEVLMRYKNLQISLDKLSNNDPLYLKQVNLEHELNDLKLLETTFNNYFIKAKDYFNGNNILVDENNKIFACLVEEKSNIIIKYNDIVNDYKNLFTEKCFDLSSNDSSLSNLSGTSLVKYVKNKHSDAIENLIKNFNQNDYYKLYVFDGFNANEKIKKLLELKNKEKINVDKEVSSIIDANVNNILGFKPTVKNVTHLLLAHLETLLYCIYKASSEINNRTIDKLKIPYSDIDVKKTNIVGLFPQIGLLTNDNNIETSWIGDILGAEDEPEIKLINGLLDGISDFEKISDLVVDYVGINEKNNSIAMTYPISPNDLINSNNIFKCDLNYSDISDFVGRLFLRISNVIGSHTKNTGGQSKGIYNKLFNEMGKCDAKNFYNEHKNPPQIFVDMLRNGALSTSEKILNFAISKGEPNKQNAWDDNNSEKTQLLIKNDEYYCISSIKKDKFKILPIVGETWEEIHESFKKSTNNNKVLTDGFTSIEDISFNEFHIDLNYQKYIDIVNGISEEYNNIKNYLGDNVFNLNFYKGYYKRNNKFNLYDIIVKKYDTSDVKGLIINSLSNKESFEDDYLCDGNIFYYKNNDKIIKKTRNIKNPFNLNGIIDDIIDNSNNISNYTISQFPGYIDGELSLSVSLFSQKEYYEINNKYLQAYLFLNLFNVDGLLYDTTSTISVKPYIFILKYGAYFWRLNEEKKQNQEITFNGSFKKTQKINKWKDRFGIEQKEKISYLDKPFNIIHENIRDDVKNKLIQEFKKWVDEFYVSEIHNQFAISSGNYDVLEDAIKEILSKKSKKITYAFSSPSVFGIQQNIKYEETRFNAYLECIKSENYNHVIIERSGKNVRFINNENSSAISTILDFLFKPCAIVKSVCTLSKSLYLDGINRINDIEFLFHFDEDSAKSYINSFLNEINVLYKDIKDDSDDTNSDVYDSNNIDKNVKIALYNYLKILWDRWLCGTELWENCWSYKSFKHRWHFIDSFYNKIGDSGTVNISNLVKDVITCQKEKGFSMLTFLSNVYSKDRYNLLCVQNFLNMVNDKKTNEMFKPLPYNKITSEMLDKKSDFIVMYTYEYSSKLELNNGNFVSDSFDLNGIVPESISNKTSEDYKVPAFGVTYGKQYQSYFKDISVSMDAPIASEQALLARFQIASMHSASSGENGKKVIPLGADLYTIYSNNSYNCTVKMMGCAWIQPLMYFQLNNIPMFKGAYLIQKVTHHIEPGNMETTIVGTRMSKYTNKLIDNNYLIKENTDNGSLNSSISHNKMSNIYNNCEYKFFNPINGNDKVGMPIEDLDLTVAEYGLKYGGWKINSLLNDSRKMSKFLGDIAFGEASNQDEIGVKLVLTVLYNRCISRGDFVKVLYNDKQHEIYKITDNIIYEQWAREIFTKTPIVLINKTAKVKRSVPIWNNGIKSNKISKNKEITLYDLQTIDGYCTTLGYDSNYDGERKGLEPYPPRWWHGKSNDGKLLNVEYRLQHDNDKVLGHVFVSGERGKVQKYWEVQNESYSNMSKEELIDGLFNSIKKTINYSDNIKINTIQKNIINKKEGIFEITTPNSQSGTAIVFDVILNTYMSYVKDIIWVTSASTSNLPTKIIISLGNEFDDKKVFMSLNEVNPIKFVLDGEKCNEYFYMSIKKRYGNELNKNSFKKECINFSYIINNNADWRNKIINMMKDIIVENCNDGINSASFDDNSYNNTSASRTYTWDSFDNNIANSFKPLAPQGMLNVGMMVNYIKNNVKNDDEDDGECASYVRTAIEKGGLIIFNYPNSACVYSKHLETWGFKLVTSGTNHDGNNFKFMNGDISVAAASRKHIHGHIQIYYNGKWYSDKIYSSIAGYKDSGVPYKVFRYIK